MSMHRPIACRRSMRSIHPNVISAGALRSPAPPGAKRLRAVFEWVEDECDLTLAPLTQAAEPVVVASNERVSAPVANTAVAAPARSATAAASSNDAGSVRVGIDKIDSLIDLVGELVITQAMLDQFREEFDPTRLALLQQGLAQLAGTHANCRKA